MKITANNPAGRLLLAMRAGRIEASTLREAFPTLCSSTLKALYKNELIEKSNGYLRLTQAGVDACPNRRDAPLEPLYGNLININMVRAHGWSSAHKQSGAAA